MCFEDLYLLLIYFSLHGSPHGEVNQTELYTTWWQRFYTLWHMKEQ